MPITKKEISDRDYIREINQNWIMDPPRISFPIANIDESRMVYRMTLGSLYYDSKIHKVEAKEPETDLARQTLKFLKSKYPILLKKWLKVKNETNNHLDYIAALWKRNILNPVDRILDGLTKEFPGLHEYHSNLADNDQYYVEPYIKDTVYQEIQHYAALGYKLNFFKIDDTGRKVGNGYTYLVSSNRKVLDKFVDLVYRVIDNEKVLREFRGAKIKKSQIESEVLEFKQELTHILQLNR